MADSDDIKVRVGASADEGSARKAGSDVAKAVESGATSAEGGGKFADELRRSIDRADKALQGFNTDTAEKMRSVFNSIRENMKRGDFAQEFSKRAGTAIRSILKAAKELPPDEFVAMEGTLHELVNLNDALSASLSDYKIDIEGIDALDEVKRKLEAIGDARNAKVAVSELNDEISELSDALQGESRRVQKAILSAFKELSESVNSGDLGERTLNKADGAAERLNRTLRKLPLDTAKRLVPAMEKVRTSLENVRKSARKVPEEFRYGFDVASLASANFGVSVDANSNAVAALISKFPGVRMGAGAFAAVSLAVAGLTALFKKLADTIKEGRTAAWIAEMASAKAGIDATAAGWARVNAQLEQHKKIVDKNIEAEKTAADVAYEYNEALKKVAYETEKFGVRDSASLYNIEARQADETKKRALAKSGEDLKKEETGIDAEIKVAKDKAAKAESTWRHYETLTSDASERLAKINDAVAAKEKAMNGNALMFYADKFSEFWSDSLEQLKAKAAEAEAQYNELTSNSISISNEKETAQKELEVAQAKKAAVAKRREILEEEQKELEQQRKNADEAERVRREEADEVRRRELADAKRRIKEGKEAFEDEMLGRYANHQDKLALANSKLNRWTERYEQARQNYSDFYLSDLSYIDENGDRKAKSETELTDEQRTKRAYLQGIVTDYGEKRISAQQEIRRMEQEGDQRRIGFEKSRQQESNRLVSLGIGGGGERWGDATAKNTGKIALDVKNIVRELQGSRAGRKLGDSSKGAGAIGTWLPLN